MSPQVDYNRDIVEAQNEPGTGDVCHIEVAAPALVVTSPIHGIPRDGPGSSAGRNLGSATHFEPQVASTPSGGELGRLTFARIITDEESSSAMSISEKAGRYFG